RNLEQLARHFDLPIPAAVHRAEEDAELLMELLQRLIAELNRPSPRWSLVAWILRTSGNPWAAFLPQRTRREPLVGIIPEWQPPPIRTPARRYDTAAVIAPLQPGGVLVAEGRSHRPRQVEMAEFVAEALAQGRTQLIE